MENKYKILIIENKDNLFSKKSELEELLNDGWTIERVDCRNAGIGQQGDMIYILKMVTNEI